MGLTSRLSAIVTDRGGLGAALRTAAKRPGAVAQALARVAAADWRALAADGSGPANRLAAELNQSGLIEGLNDTLRAEFMALDGAKVRGKTAVAGGMRALHAELLWLLTRGRKPGCIVETGVCNGLSSAVLLEALAKNGGGRLASVDLPEFTDPAQNTFEIWEGKGGAAIPAGREVGWLVRPELRPSWRLELGLSQEILPGLLAELGPIDMFIHDSEHSYDNQLFEFRAGYAALRPGGVLVATDITWSDAFEHFFAEVKGQGGGVKRAFVDPSCAIVVKG